MKPFWVSYVVLAAATCGLVGCSGLASNVTAAPVTALQLSGSVHGGQQPVSGATIQLYAVGITGDGSAPTPLLTPSIQTNAAGGFILTGLYTCPDPNALVYMTATGGNPGLAAGTNNPALGLMTALGTCGSLTPSTFIHINEVTTVAAAAGLAPFITAPFNIGASPANASALAAAFLNAATYANFASGTAPGAGQFADATLAGQGVPVSTINTLANILAACVNTASGSSTTCTQLFALTGSPSNTLSAIVALEKNPAAYDTASLYALAAANAPFQPTLTTAPNGDFGIAVIVPTGGSNAVRVIPTTVYEGSAFWVASNTSNCLYQSPTIIQIGNSSYATGGTQGCGRIYGIVPAGIPFGIVTGKVFTSSGGQTYNIHYPYYLNVVPKPDTSIAFSPTTLYWIGTAGAKGYQLGTDIVNHTNADITLSAPVISGGGASNFVIDTTNSTCTTTLPAGSNCHVFVFFNPTTPSLVQGSLTVTGTSAAQTKAFYATAVLAGTGMN